MIDGVLTFRFTTNSGGAFSIGRVDAPWFFATASIVVSGAHRGHGVPPHDRDVGGRARDGPGRRVGQPHGSGDLRGPALRGRVVDFIDLHVWPVFNLADTAIVVGALILAFGSFLDGRPPTRARMPEADDVVPGRAGAARRGPRRA